jgi:hypothetical protein
MINNISIKNVGPFLRGISEINSILTSFSQDNFDGNQKRQDLKIHYRNIFYLVLFINVDIQI